MKIEKRGLTHGLWYNQSTEYRAWIGMIKRCHPARIKRSGEYVGISVHKRWRGKKSGFKNFLSDMGKRPKGKTSLDRINSSGNYEPGNCRWANWTEQARNRKSNRIVMVNGKFMTVSEAAPLLGIKAFTICVRLRKGWSLQDALYTPTGVRRIKNISKNQPG